jgi:hypothetical protein
MPRKSAKPKSTAVRKTTTEVAIAAHRDHGLEKIIKAAELVRARPAKSRTLSLLASKCLNLMLGVAGGEGFVDKMYSIPKKELRRAHKGNERLPAMLEELQTTLFKLDVLSPRGKPAILTAVLLSSTIDELDDQTDDSLVYFRFTLEFIAIHKHSNLWAALSARIMLGFDSVYALRLYEIGCQMVGRADPTIRVMVPELRELLHVPPGKLVRWPDLRRYALDAAITEVNELAHFTVLVPENRIRRSGRKVVSLEIQFWKKPNTEPEALPRDPERQNRRENRVEPMPEQKDLEVIWRKVCRIVEKKVGDQRVRNWLSQAYLHGIHKGCALLTVKEPVARDWIMQRLEQPICEALAEVTKSTVTEIKVAVEHELSSQPAPLARHYG